MGKIALGILDGVSGKVGNVVGASWKGIDYIRAKAAHRNDPKTVRQMQQRSRFKGLSDFAKPLLPNLIRPIWNSQAGKMTGRNLFMKVNMPAFGSDGEIVDFSKLVFSVGTLDNPYILDVEKNEGVESGISLSWDELGEEDHSGDGLLIVAMDETGQLFTDLKGDVLRGDGASDIVLPFAAGTKAHVFVFFTDSERRVFSPSQHFEVAL